MLLVAFDLETHRFQPGINTPPIVCAAWCDGNATRIEKPDALKASFLRFFDGGYTFCGANIAFDFCCVANEHPELLQKIFELYDTDRVFDVLIAEKLYAIGHGIMDLHPVNFTRLSAYNLENVAEIHGVPNAKINDAWVTRYHELEDLPINMWPTEARQYPQDDVYNTRIVAVSQLARVGVIVPQATNLHNQSAQARTSFAMALGGTWGFLVDQTRVADFKTEVTAKRATMIDELIRAGFYRADGSKDTTAVKRAVALAYGDKVICGTCTGGGLTQPIKRVSEKTGKALKDEPGKKCKPCDGTGLAPCERIPLTATGAISGSRDTLEEADDPTLEKLAQYGELDRAVSAYIPYFEAVGDAPLTLSGNNPLETGRTSYRGLIQLLPKAGPIRECIYPRPGHVFYSVDYEGIELATHAQNCLWTVGYSKLAEALNGGAKPHNMLAATLARLSDAEFEAKYKAQDPRMKALRSAAKPANFGFPGGMGPIKLVHQQRAQGPDTVGPDGTHYAGLRFCILLGYAERCGVKKIYTHQGRPVPPTCPECVAAATDLRKAWFTRWEENVDYFAFISREVKDRGYLKQHVSNRYRGRVEFCDGANTLFQGLAADGATAALYAVTRAQYNEPRSPLFGSRTIAFAHDELIGECAEATAHETVTEVERVMVTEMKRFVPDVVVRAERTLMSRWYKQAALIFDEQQRVAVWSPTPNKG